MSGAMTIAEPQPADEPPEVTAKMNRISAARTQSASVLHYAGQKNPTYLLVWTLQ